MPVYNYKCPTHGDFCELATARDAHKPYACPDCGKMSPRVIIESAHIPSITKRQMHAYEVNEKSQHAPIRSAVEQGEIAREAQTAIADSQAPCATSKSSKVVYTASGEKMFPSERPWMIGHG